MSVIDVAAGLVFENGRLLITQRPPGSHLAGLWEFPGGKLEAGETFEAALVRELREELGIEVEVGREFCRVQHAYPQREVRLRFLVCRIASGTPMPIGCSAVSWVGPDELGRFEFPEADRQLLEQLPMAPEFGP
ncbi:MAG: 8-oxo-dGTP diphosphatase MutT [Limisphaerales bacterium]